MLPHQEKNILKKSKVNQTHGKAMEPKEDTDHKEAPRQ